MASQDPSTAYTAAPEKKSGSFFSSFPSFSLPKLPDFFGPSTPAASPAPAPATAIAEQSSVQPGGRRRRGSKKAGRRTRRSKKGGIPPRFLPGYVKPAPPAPPAQEAKAAFGPTPVRKGGRRTRRVKKHSRR
jgi:hypothetical protein